MGLKELNLKFYYDNDEDNLINEFYNPVISVARKYKRATGFFSSSSFWEIVDGLQNFIECQGKIQLIVSPNLSKEDIEAINLGKKAKEDTIEAFLIANILEESKYTDQFNLLAWLIYEEKLDIKIVMKNDVNSYGIFHDKSAIIYDNEGEKIAFHGSLNESSTAYNYNFESINVFLSWNESDKKRIEKIEESFDRIWNNKSSNWISYSIPETIKEKIVQKRAVNIISLHKSNRNEFTIPDDFKLREYQKKAIDEWIKNRCSGILEMATGSGKTFTAIFALNKIMNMIKEKGFPCGVVIVVPYKNLLEQWCNELKKFNVNPTKCYKAKYLWYYDARNLINDFNHGSKENLFIITTNSTFITNTFQELINNIKRDYIFCVDEMHHLLAPQISKLLPSNTNFRLGLTATLFNEYEKEKATEILSYFNKIVFNFSLEDAIKNDCLTRYYYYPIFIDLNDEERTEYIDLTRKISKLLNYNEDDDVLKLIISKRRRIILNAKNKISKFSEMKNEIKKYDKVLVYCGDKIDEEGRFINKINRIVYNMGIKTHTYSSELKDSYKEEVLKRFKDGQINVLTAIRCLDEGVDIPSLECAFILASNMDSKQFIQRRGRILRKAPGKKFAYIYDFVVVPTLDKEIIDKLNYEELKIEKKIFSNELERVLEFASLCENKVEAIKSITDVFKLYN